MIYAYLRFSSANQSDGVSIETQRTSINAFVKARPELRALTIVECIDEAKSATTMRGRNGLERIRRDAVAGDMVVVYKLDRFARNLLEALKLLKELEERHVRVLSSCEPEMPLVQHVLLAMSEEFSRQLSDRCKRSLDHCASNGFAANKPPYGYEIVRQDGRAKFSVVPERAAAVRRIFEMRARGQSARAIATTLNAERVPSPRKGVWHASCITAMLKCETYLGTVISGHRKFKKGHGLVEKRPRSEWSIKRNAHEAIIDDLLWQRVRELDRAVVGRKKTTRAPAKYLLSGFLKCATCGSNLIVDRCGDAKFYGCASGRETGIKKECNHRYLVRVDLAEKLVVQTLLELVYSDELVSDLISVVKQEVRKAKGEVGKVLPTLQQQLQRLENQVESAIRRLVTVPEEDIPVFQNELKRLKADRDDLKRRIDATKNASGGDVNTAELESQLRERIRLFGENLTCIDVSKARSMLAESVDRIEVTGEKDATIYSKFAPSIASVLSGIPTGI